MKIGEVDYRLVEVKRKWWQWRSQWCVVTPYSTWGPMSEDAARTALVTIRDAQPK